MATKFRALEGAAPYVLHMEAGADVFGELKKFFVEGNWTEVVVMGCAGSLDKAVVCYPKDAQLPR